MCDRLKSVDECTVNPPDQFGGCEAGEGGGGVSGEGQGGRLAREEEEAA